jgi:hypothetical protein
VFSRRLSVFTQTPGKHPKENILHIKYGERLKSRILQLYGEDTTRHIHLFEKLRIKYCNSQAETEDFSYVLVAGFEDTSPRTISGTK